MVSHSFESCGTVWTLVVDTSTVDESTFQCIQQQTDDFDRQYSRFKEDSEVSQFRSLEPGTYEVSPILAELLQSSKVLEDLTKGGFNVAVGTLMEQAGYDALYSLQAAPENATLNWQAPTWSIKEKSVTFSEPLVFDIGGIGKGYWIDVISRQLSEAGYPYHLVDGGGDMFGTSKADEQPWTIAVEWPGKTDTALGVIEIFHQGFAASDTFRRRWKQWNHLIHAVHGTPQSQLKGCCALGPSAFIADQITSGLSFAPAEKRAAIVTHFHGTALTVDSEDQVQVYNDWPGQRFF